MKHWTEPNGIFIINIPIEWQYKNAVFRDAEEVSPYSFEPYENSTGCFQISCYSLAEKGINPNFQIQKSNSQIEWFETDMNDEEFDILLFYAQVDDSFCMAKYIYSKQHRNDKEITEQKKNVKAALDSFRIIPINERLLASNLNKYDNFLASLATSYDLSENAYKSNSYIELVAILSNQIDAFLRLSIVLHTQLENKTNDIEIQYIFQGENQKGIIERKIYSTAFELQIIDNSTFKELNELYDLRNKVIHRYIISFIKTRDIADTAYHYTILNEKIRLILKSFEDRQANEKVGIYGNNLKEESLFDDLDYKRAYSWANDKHLIDRLERKI